MTWPSVITKLAEIGLDDYAPKLKELGYDSMDAFDTSDKEALQKIADELDLKSGYKAKFVKKFYETSDAPSMGIAVAPPPQPEVTPEKQASSQVVVVQTGAENDKKKIPATWLIGEYNGNFEDAICCESTINIAAVGDDAFDLWATDENPCGADSGKMTFTRMGHTNNFNPAGQAQDLASYCCDLSLCCGCCYASGTSIAGNNFNVVLVVDENHIRGGSELNLEKSAPTKFATEDAAAKTTSPSVQYQSIERA